jgi:hypothetical protein
MRLFRSKPKENYMEGADKPRQQIEQKLSECTAQLKEADAELSRLSLAAFQTGDAAAALAVLDKLRALENQRDLLVAALVECQRQEAERQKAFRAAQTVSQKRALAQHAGALNRSAADVAAALVALRDATERLTASGQSVIAVLPNHLRTGASPFHELLSADGIAKAIAVEQFRLQPSGPKPRPGWEYEDRRTGRITPMTDRLAALVAQVREDFDCAPKPPKPISPVVGDDAPTVASDVPASVAGDGQAAFVPTGRLRGVAVNASSGELVELTEPFAPGEQDGSEQARCAVVKAAVDMAAPVAEMAAPIERSAHGAVDYTKLFHGGNQ